MDPVTQGTIGAVLPQALGKKNLGIVALLGFLSGMAPDLDILIRSSTDPLLSLEYHRQFTHSLIFIPFGGLICALFLFVVLKKISPFNFKKTWLYCALGYGTHGLIDACTSYGTLLFWPFSDARISWNNISIIDPLFTLPLILLIVIATIKKKNIYSKIALAWAATYLTLGVYLHNVAINVGKEIAEQRGHIVTRIKAKPSFGNLILWKTIYETDNQFYVDATNLLFNKIIPGESIKKLNQEEDFPWLKEESQQYKDVERFKWFSNDFLAVNPQNKNQIIDIRYSGIPNEIGGLWGVQLNPNKHNQEHVEFVSMRNASIERFKILRDMILKN
ncbi:MAG: metal-dependent hydrolase [Flavobacteriales bacterium]|nr:metal-dependent hydrolase [Flavobacteriales bacterium]